MKINMSKVLVGGIIAGIVMVAIDMVNNLYILGPKSMAEAEAFKPGLGNAMTAGNAMIIYPLLTIVMGIVLVWTYAAIRPRFGPGPATAVKTAIPFWVALDIAYYGYMQMGMMTSGTWWGFALIGLVSLILGTMAGAKFYTEEGAA